MCSSCGRISEARSMFDNMSHRDIVAWSIRIDGYCQSGLFNDALELFDEMNRTNVGDLRKLIKQRYIQGKGMQQVELENEVHEFLMADGNPEQADKIYEKLDDVFSQLKLIGYSPNVGCVLVDLEDEVVLWHSEKSALCYGLIRGESDSRISILKNLWVCEDRHTFIKMVLKVYGREIIVRDRRRFHHYKDGVCSCKDYW